MDPPVFLTVFLRIPVGELAQSWTGATSIAP